MVPVLNEPWGARARETWRDVGEARRVLSCLAATAADAGGAGAPPALSVAASDRGPLASWLLRNDLAALAFAAAWPDDADLAGLLREAAAGGAAGNLAHLATLRCIERCFASARLPMILLKGAAIASSGYRDPSLRPMTDLDIWIRDDDMPRAVEQLRELGFRQEAGPPHRPAALQKRSRGELVFRHGRGEHGLVELHYGAFQGWWVRRAAAPDDEALWRRAVPAGPGRHALRLSTEDAILQTAFHVAVNQFGQVPLRGLMDLAVLARAHSVDWLTVAARARDWRLATVTWLVLDTAHQLVGLPGCEAALAGLRPAPARRAALSAFVTPRSLLAGRDLTRRLRRPAFMMSLVDRRRDGMRVIGRTLWPERWWITARYGRPVSRVRHLFGLVLRGEA